jgi:hypothetical protein
MQSALIMKEPKGYLIRRDFEFNSSYYKLVGFDTANQAVYVRTSRLSGNEYNMADQNMVSSNSDYRLNSKAYNLEIIARAKASAVTSVSTEIYQYEETLTEDVFQKEC